MSDHIYHNTFSSGATITLTVHFFDDKITCESTPVPTGCDREYKIWRLEVANDIVSRSTPQQLEYLADKVRNHENLF